MAKASIPTCGGRTTYWECNPDKPGALIILHGLRGSHQALIPMSEYLNSYRVILPDRPGYGESDRFSETHTVLNYSSWLDEFISQLGLTHFVVWGHSYGATIALIHAARGSRKPLAAVVVSTPLPGRALEWLGALYYQVGRAMPTTLRKLWLTNKAMERAAGGILLKATHGQERNRLLSEGVLNLEHIQPDVITEEYFSAIRTDLHPCVKTIAAPILFVTGARDIIAPLNHVRNLVSEAQQGILHVMPDQGHLAPLEAAGKTAALTDQFLQNIVGH
jgi:pimeloyl-ACP methyl ester carboxylesterase